MKSESKTLLWGAIIALVLVGIESILVTRFPHLQLPISTELMKFSLSTAVFIVLLIFAYKGLLRRAGYWLLLGALLVVHAGSYALFLSGGTGTRIGDDSLIGAIAGLEFIGFALVVYKIYRVGPKIRWL